MADVYKTFACTEITELNKDVSLTDILLERRKATDKKVYFVWYYDEATDRSWVPAGNC